MNPKKAKDLLAEVSQQTGVDLLCLKELSSFYWDAIHRELTSLNSNYVMVPHLGTFTIKNEKTLLKTIDRYERLVTTPRRRPPKTMVRYAIYQNNEDKLAQLYKMLDRMHADDLRWESLYKLRKDARDIKEGVGQPVQDNGGDNQYGIHPEGSGENSRSENEDLQCLPTPG